MAHHHNPDCLVKWLGCFVVVKVTEMPKNSSECSSGWYLLNSWTFCNQTWYGDASWWASVVQEDWCAVFKFRVTVQAHLIRFDCFYHSCWTADLFATKFNLMVHHHKLECCVKIGLFSRSRSQWRFKTLLNLYVSYIFCTTDLLATIEVCLFTIHNNQTKYNKVGIYWQ